MLCLCYNRDKIILLPMLCGVINLKIQLQVGKFQCGGNIECKKIDGNVWASSGYPADCVITAITSNVFENVKFDLVISGINRGPNVGTDIIYSGTCAGARQGALLNIPSIALSVNSEDGKFCATSIFDYKSLALFVKNNAFHMSPSLQSSNGSKL